MARWGAMGCFPARDTPTIVEAIPVRQPSVHNSPPAQVQGPTVPPVASLPNELQLYREQCSAGVRQAAAMVMAMEQQLNLERSRRQQAEADVQVLLAAIHGEREQADSAVREMAAALHLAEAAPGRGQLQLRAEELPLAAAAATTIQKNFRALAARKEVEGRLADILRGIDPGLDPSSLSSTAQHHLSGVNAAGPPRRMGIRASMEDLGMAAAPGSAGKGGPTLAMRRQVESIERRHQAAQEAGPPQPDALESADLELQRILQGSLPASSAAVIAALVRRCKQLQGALEEVVGRLEQSRLAEQGLRQENDKIAELSEVRLELEEERAARSGLQAMVARLRHLLTHQSAASSPTRAGSPNPYVTAWYRRQQALGELGRLEPSAPPGELHQAYVANGPEAEVELWDECVLSQPHPPSHQPEVLICMTCDTPRALSPSAGRTAPVLITDMHGSLPADVALGIAWAKPLLDPRLPSQC
ncbi:hypothetical protein V8C86DRAFT_2546377 [Haematococcus lacustris]